MFNNINLKIRVDFCFFIRYNKFNKSKERQDNHTKEVQSKGSRMIYPII